MRFNGSHSAFFGGHTSLTQACAFSTPRSFLRIYWADKWRPPSEVCTCTSALRRIWLPRLPASTDMACRRGDGSYPMWISLGKSCHVISWYHDISCDIWESSSGDDLRVLEWDWCNILSAAARRHCRQDDLQSMHNILRPETAPGFWVPFYVCHAWCAHAWCAHAPKELILRMVDLRGGESVSHVAHHQAADLPQLGPAASGRLLPKEDAPRSAGGWPGENGMEHHSPTNLASFSMGISSTKGRSYHCQVCFTPVCCAIQEHETWVLFPYSLTIFNT